MFLSILSVFYKSNFDLLQALIAAVNETAEEDIRDALKAQTDHHLALVPRGPKVVRDTVAYNTTVNTDDTVIKIKYFYVCYSSLSLDISEDMNVCLIIYSTMNKKT